MAIVTIKRSTTAGNVPTLIAGELGINLADRLLFANDSTGTRKFLNFTSDAEKVASGAIADALNLRALKIDLGVISRQTYSVANGGLSAGQTVFNVAAGYTAGTAIIFLDNTWLNASQFIATDGTTFTINDPVIDATSVVEFVGYKLSGVVNAAPLYHTHAKTDVGLGNVDNTSDSTKVLPGNPIGDKFLESVSINDPSYRKLAPELNWNSAFARAVAVSNYIIIPPGIFDVDELALQSNITYEWKGGAFLRRVSNATGNYALKAISQSNFTLINAKIDCNQANQTKGATGIYLSNCNSFTINGLTCSGHYSTDGGNLGVGIHIQDCVDVGQSTDSTIRNANVIGSGGTTPISLSGILVERSGNLRFDSPTSTNHRYGDIVVDNQNTPFSSVTQSLISINNAKTRGGAVGISILRNRQSVQANGDLFSYNAYSSTRIVVTSPMCVGHKSYGMLIQAESVSVVSPMIHGCGSDASNGGMCINSRNYSITGGIISDNVGQYGIDAGASVTGIISGVVITNNGLTTNSNRAGIGLNLGASINVLAMNNIIRNNGGAGGGAEILASALDGSNSTNWIGWVGGSLIIKNNSITINNAAMVPMQITNGWLSVAVEDNEIENNYGTNSIICYGSTPDQMRTVNNRIKLNSSFHPASVTSAATIVIPDQGQVIKIAGTSTITNIKTYSQNLYLAKVTRVIPNSFPVFTANPTVTISGGTGSGATAVAVYDATRKLIGVYITNGGSYTVAPTISVTDGQTNVSCAVSLGCDNAQERIVTLGFEANAVVQTGGNIYVNGTFTANQYGLSSLTLRGEFGNWYEISRTSF